MSCSHGHFMHYNSGSFFSQRTVPTSSEPCGKLCKREAPLGDKEGFELRNLLCFLEDHTAEALGCPLSVGQQLEVVSVVLSVESRMSPSLFQGLTGTVKLSFCGLTVHFHVPTKLLKMQRFSLWVGNLVEKWTDSTSGIGAIQSGPILNRTQKQTCERKVLMSVWSKWTILGSSDEIEYLRKKDIFQFVLTKIGLPFCENSS